MENIISQIKSSLSELRVNIPKGLISEMELIAYTEGKGFGQTVFEILLAGTTVKMEQLEEELEQQRNAVFFITDKKEKLRTSYKKFRF